MERCATSVRVTVLSSRTTGTHWCPRLPVGEVRQPTELTVDLLGVVASGTPTASLPRLANGHAVTHDRSVGSKSTGCRQLREAIA